jgi:DNA-binding MarR family transcriptional regulator
MDDVADIDATALFPPLTVTEARVLRVLVVDPTRELSAEMIAERTGLTVKRAERALDSLRSRRPPLVEASPSDRITRAWQPPATYSLAASVAE